MADRLAPERRLALMARIKGKDTLPERLLRAELYALGVAYEANDRSLPGTPDIAIHAWHVAVFVHGCFWHGCPDHYREPQVRTVFWRQKLARVRHRDRLAAERLRASGWKVAVLWEHEVRESPREAARRIASLRTA